MSDNKREKDSDEMTLRDYFAAAVLPVVYTAYVQDGYPKFETMAKDAYELADTMLYVRIKS